MGRNAGAAAGTAAGTAAGEAPGDEAGDADAATPPVCTFWHYFPNPRVVRQLFGNKG